MRASKVQVVIRDSTEQVAGEIRRNRTFKQDHPNGSSIETVAGDDVGRWFILLSAEFGMVSAQFPYEPGTEAEILEQIRAELLGLATVSVAWIAAIDRVGATRG